jgi:hypothetical protein
MVKGRFSRRLRLLWRLHLSEPYATGISIAVVVGCAVLVSVRFDLEWLSALATSVLDIKPVLLFLLGWCVVRFFQLAAHGLFPTGKVNFRVASRLRRAMADGSLIYVAAAWGAVFGLWLTEEGKHHPLIGLMLSLFMFALAYPLLLAFGVLSNHSPGLSRANVRWLKLGVSIVLLVVMLAVQKG